MNRPKKNETMFEIGKDNLLMYAQTNYCRDLEKYCDGLECKILDLASKYQKLEKALDKACEELYYIYHSIPIYNEVQK